MISLQQSDFGNYEVLSDDGQSLLVQLDWDFPSLASTFGWSPANVEGETACSHTGTDGTVACGCGVSVGTFIASARDYLDAHIGVEVEDPGYFEIQDGARS